MNDRTKNLETQVEQLEAQIEQLSHSKKQLDLVIHHTGIGIWDWQVQTGEFKFNRRWADIVGYTVDELSPFTIDIWEKLAHPEDLKECNRRLEKLWSGEAEYYVLDSRMKHKDGHWVWVHDTGQVTEWISEGVPKRMIGTHLDITEQKENQIKLFESNKKLLALSHTDALTEIANRRAYEERFTIELNASNRSVSPLSLMMIDVDCFKQYNDNYGHDQGDIALKTIAKCLQASLARSTDFVARFGGEEFVVLLPFTGIENAGGIAQDILTNVLKAKIKHDYSSTGDYLTLSIGISSTECDIDQIFVHADKALYQAKQAGRNCYQIYQP